MSFPTQQPMKPNLVESYEIVGMMRNATIQGDACNVKQLRGFILTTSKTNFPTSPKEEEEIIFS